MTQWPIFLFRQKRKTDHKAVLTNRQALKMKDQEIEDYLRRIKKILIELRGGASCSSGPCQLSEHVYIGGTTDARYDTSVQVHHLLY